MRQVHNARCDDTSTRTHLVMVFVPFLKKAQHLPIRVEVYPLRLRMVVRVCARVQTHVGGIRDMSGGIGVCESVGGCECMSAPLR